MHLPAPNPTRHATPGFSCRGVALPRAMSETSLRLACQSVHDTPLLRVGLGVLRSSLPHSETTKSGIWGGSRVPTRAKLNFFDPTYVFINGTTKPMPTQQTVTPPRTSKSARHLVSHHPNRSSSRCSAPSGWDLRFSCTGGTFDRPAVSQPLRLLSDRVKKDPVIPNGAREVRTVPFPAFRGKNPSSIPNSLTCFSWLYSVRKLKTQN